MNHRAKKRFGQNFLCDDFIISNIVSSIAPQKDDIMIEIGPGLGAITIPLLDSLDREPRRFLTCLRESWPHMSQGQRQRIEHALEERLVHGSAAVIGDLAGQLGLEAGNAGGVREALVREVIRYVEPDVPAVLLDAFPAIRRETRRRGDAD